MIQTVKTQDMIYILFFFLKKDPILVFIDFDKAVAQSGKDIQILLLGYCCASGFPCTAIICQML